MEENAIVKFFKKIHLTVVDAQYLATQSLSATTKSVFLFFALVFFISITISAVSRATKITTRAPEILVSALGVLRFEDYNLVSPDTLKSVDGWRIKEIGALISGVRIPQAVAYPIEITIGTDSINASENPFVHIGTSAFSTNILPAIFNNKSKNINRVSWNKILSSPNAVVDVNFYSAEFAKISNKINVFLGTFVIISIEMFSAILQIWISILIYLLFFGRKLNFFGRFRMLMLAAIPYFILLPISLAATNGTPWTTDIALIGGLIMTFRAVSRLDPIEVKGNGNDAKK